MNEWIQVSSNRFPENHDFALATVQDGDDLYVDKLEFCFFKGKPTWSYITYDEDEQMGSIVIEGVIAWMPLPEPFDKKKFDEWKRDWEDKNRNWDD